VIAELMQRLKTAFPKRDGAHGWGAVPRLLEKALACGSEMDRIELGTKNYAKHCQRKGMLGTEFVMQARTFYGRDQHWEEWADLDLRTPAEISIETARVALIARAARIGFRQPTPGEPAFRYEMSLKEAERASEPRAEPKFAVVR
jgi:hypothetical protein